MTNYTLHIPDADLTDLAERLARTRFADLPTDDWTAGTPVPWLRDLVEQWKHLDWRAVEARINARPGFTTEIDGQTIFFQHIRSRERRCPAAAAGPHLPGVVPGVRGPDRSSHRRLSAPARHWCVQSRSSSR